MKPYVVDGKMMMKRMGIVLLTGIFLGLNVALYSYKQENIEAGEQKKAMSVCSMPQAEGEMTIYVVEGKVIKCWRWK